MIECKPEGHLPHPRFLRWPLLAVVVLGFGSLQLGACLLRGRLGSPLWVSVLCGAGSFLLPLAWLTFASGLRGFVRLGSQVLIVLIAVGVLRAYPLNEPLAVAPGFRFSLFAEEPLVVHPVAIAIDNANRLFVVETHCHFDAFSVAYHDEELAVRTAEEAKRLWERELQHSQQQTHRSEQVRLVRDLDGDGKADRAETFAGGFELTDGVAGGLVTRDGKAWLANSPNLWLLEDADGDGRAEKRAVLHRGFGLRRSMIGHCLHGLIFGPDGKLYFTMGDRGICVEAGDGRTLSVPETGAVLRCNADGTDLEVFATGLRNPQELVFDQYGSLWTWDNDANVGDECRWIYVVEGGDYGWHIGMQSEPGVEIFLNERLWATDPSAHFCLPPVACFGRAPCGLAFYPGTGLPARYQDRFFVCDYADGVHAIAVEQRGAGYEVVQREKFIDLPWASDLAFGTDGSIYVASWVVPEKQTNQGRLWRIWHQGTLANPLAQQTQRILAAGMNGRAEGELAALLHHRDLRVRQQAQFALAVRGGKAIGTLVDVLENSHHQLARIHAIWALGQVSQRDPATARHLLSSLDSPDAEIRAQAARAIGESKYQPAYQPLIDRLEDPSLRVRYFATLGLGKLGRKKATIHILNMLRDASQDDRFVRHSAVMSLVRLEDLACLSDAAHDASRSVRLAALLALRRLARAEVARFLDDPDPELVAEAIRAIHDVPIPEGMPAVASMIHRRTLPESTLSRVINANYRLGTAASAEELAELASDHLAQDAARADALRALAQWSQYTGRDRVLGLWRPLPPRATDAAAAALRARVDELLCNTPTAVATAAATAARRLCLRQTSRELFQRLGNEALATSVRVDALETLGLRRDATLASAVEIALATDQEPLRLEALRLIPHACPQEAVDRLKHIALGNESIAIRQTAVTSLGQLTDRAAGEALSDLLDRSLAGQIPRQLDLELVEATEQHDAAMLREKLQALRSRRPVPELLAEHWETLQGGSSTAGAELFHTHPKLQCVRCHCLQPSKQSSGPSLANVGRLRSRQYLLQAIVSPNAVITEGYGQTTFQMSDGSTVVGRIQSEDQESVRILLPDGKRATLRKAEVEQRSDPVSPMPDNLAIHLSKRELRDLVEFLSQLGVAQEDRGGDVHRSL